MRQVRAVWRVFWEPPDEAMLQTSGGGELFIARARIGLTSALLAVAALSYIRAPEVTQSRIHLAGGLLAVPFSIVVFVLMRRVHYRWWIGLATSVFDVTMVSAALAAFLVAGNPLAALNNPTVYPLFFLALAATSMRLDHRACAAAGAAAVVQYSTIVLVGMLVWDLDAPQLVSQELGRIDPGSQMVRVVLLGAMGILGTLVNLRMQRPYILSAADPLTSLQNRRMFEERWQGEVARARRYGRPISVAAIDIDYFKQFNDTYGHAGGDAALRSVGRLLRSRIRAGDFAARMGGEEFVVALPETNAANAMAMADQLRLAIAGIPIRIPGHNGPGRVTVSIGVASWPEHGEEITRLLERADNRLYEAKLAGRDQVKGPGSRSPADAGRFRRGSLKPI